MPYPKHTKTRAFIKIQDGCNNFCSYCIIPYLRGRETSRPAEDVLNEISVTDSPEIVLNGINISSYEGGLDKLISAMEGVNKRVRLGSLECGVIEDKLCRRYGTCPTSPRSFICLCKAEARTF